MSSLEIIIKILFIPDTQARPGDDFDFLRCIGEYIMDKRPDVIVHAGDFADMESCSSWDIGKKSFEGRRYQKDIAAAHEAMEALLGPMRRHNLTQQRNKKGPYRPRMVMTMGNHEDRISRAVNANAMLDGAIGLADLKYEYYGWEVHDFLKVVIIGGIAFSHYFQTGAMGRPAASAQAQLAKKHMSTVAGHQQGLSTASAYRADGKRMQSIIAGSAYCHSEGYLGPQGNQHWHGVIMLHNVDDGEFDPMYVPLHYIKSKYAR